jgi:hypothetical protein
VPPPPSSPPPAARPRRHEEQEEDLSQTWISFPVDPVLELLLGTPDDRGTSGDQVEEVRGRVARLGLRSAGIWLPGFQGLGHLARLWHPCAKVDLDEEL